MKLVTSQVMAEIDRITIRERGVAGVTLMERAGASVADLVRERYGSVLRPGVLIVAGCGNNGGDGFVVARLLSESGWHARVALVGSRREVRGDAAAMLELLPREMVREVTDREGLLHLFSDMEQVRVVVDALFGTGLSRDVEGVHAEAIEMINRSGRPVVSIDIPSGIDGSTGGVLGSAVRADVTVTFGLPKIGHATGAGLDHTGELLVSDIGFPADLLEAADGIGWCGRIHARSLLRPRRKGCHKGENGRILIIAGSTGKTGAAHLAASAAVRGGAGLVTLAVPAALDPILEVKTTEAMTLPVGPAESCRFTTADLPALREAARGADVVALGPGIGLFDDTTPFVAGIVSGTDRPMVLDADALNAISLDLSILRGRPPGSIVITPHPGEMARLCGTSIREVERDRAGGARAFAREHGVVVVLKGGGTVVAHPDGRCAVNTTGNPGMASGGMGDVLTGLVAALLGQGYEAFHAALLAVHLHGLAADLVMEERGMIGMTATDVHETIPRAYRHLLTESGGLSCSPQPMS